MQAVDDPFAFFFVEVEDCLGIRSRAVPVTPRLEAGPKLGMVVDLAVENDPDSPVLVAHRLLAAADVHDRKAPMCQPGAAVDDQPLSVRPAVRDAVAHPHEPIVLSALAWVELDDAGYSAHLDDPT